MTYEKSLQHLTLDDVTMITVQDTSEFQTHQTEPLMLTLQSLVWKSFDASCGIDSLLIALKRSQPAAPLRTCSFEFEADEEDGAHDFIDLLFQHAALKSVHYSMAIPYELDEQSNMPSYVSVDADLAVPDLIYRLCHRQERARKVHRRKSRLDPSRPCVDAMPLQLETLVLRNVVFDNVTEPKLLRDRPSDV